MDKNKKIKKEYTAREAAFRSLMRLLRTDGYANIETETSAAKYDLKEDDRALYTALVMGVTGRAISLDWLVGQFSSRKPEKLDRDVLTVLRLGFYQLFFMDRIPDHAAVNETVELAKNCCARGAAVSGFVNAVMRSALRGRDKLKWPDPALDRVSALSVRHSLPEWLVRLWLKGYPENAEALMEYANSTPPLTLRVNTLRTTAESLRDRIEADGFKAEIHSDTPYAVTTDASYNLLSEKYPGEFFVQDRASQTASEAFGAEAGESILDACAAPGGKSFYSALRMNNDGKIISCDIHKNKPALIQEGAEALGITIIKPIISDSSKPDERLKKQLFDRVLCDVPCSGLGVIAKKPDIRYKDKKQIDQLPEKQFAILENCSNYVRPGGILMYSTCTLVPDENEGVAEKFTEKHPEFINISSRTLFPDADGCDGFYFSIWKRNL
ncbi:MAG: 16S rRNA (cytosine(967)-C(5))-methyltransferase RsmB [Eubacteriales bacterium]|jgi:16S rRNA (cytosine967-C5)-methyltransferase